MNQFNFIISVATLMSLCSNIQATEFFKENASQPFSKSLVSAMKTDEVSVPSAVSTFEAVTSVNETTFTDGTASFQNFQIVDNIDGIGANNLKAASIQSGAKVTLTNSTTGLTLTGFYLISDQEVTLKLYKQSELVRTVTLDAAEEWTFMNLKSYGDLTDITFETTGNAYIDDFSGEPQPFEMLADEELSENENEPFSIDYMVAGGVTPYSYAWKNAAHEVLSTEEFPELSLSHSNTLTLEVTDAWNQKISASILVEVLGTAYTATFDDLYLAPESHWAGDTETEEALLTTEFFSGSYAFNNLIMPDYDTWSFFGYSNETSTSYTTLKDQYRSSVGAGVNNSKNYAVVYSADYMGKTITRVTNNEEGEVIKGFYVTNSAYTRNAILNGDGYCSSFVQNDSLILIVKGYDSDNTLTGTVRYALADYRGEKAADHYCLNTWQWIDLRSLGRISKLEYKMEGSQNSDLGLSTPTYFCMDDFNGERNEELVAGITVPVGKSSTNISSYFSFDPEVATVNYRIVDAATDPFITGDMNGSFLNLNADKDGSDEFVVMGVQQGKQEFKRIPVTFDATLSCQPIEANDIQVNYQSGILKVNSSLSQATVTIMNLSGMNVLNTTIEMGNSNIALDHLDKGVYFVQIVANGTKKVTKIYVR